MREFYIPIAASSKTDTKNELVSIGDMLRRCNYGMALRGGYPTIVLLDNGLTDEIYNDYYSKR